MPALPWATDAQTDFLLARIPDYKDAQKTDLPLRNSAYNKFWTSLYEAWEIAYPERSEVFPTKSATEDLSEDEKEILTEAFKVRRERLKTWFRWRTTQKARSRKTAKSKDLVQALSKPTRALQPAEMYSKLHYKTEIRDQVHALIKNQGIVDRAGKLNIIKKVTREKFLAGGNEVKFEIESKLADIAKAKAKENEDTHDRKPQQYLDAIQDCPALLGQFLDILSEKTGWAFTVLMGGPDPQSNGDISVASYHVGETQLGNQFGTVHPDFEKVYMEPFTEFLVNLFPEDIRRSRSLRSEEVQDDLLSMDGSDSETQCEVGSSKEESEGVESADLPSPSSPLPTAPISSFGESEPHFPQMSTTFLDWGSSNAPNASSSQLSIGMLQSGQVDSAAHGSLTTTDASASVQPFFDFSTTTPLSAPPNTEDNASLGWTFPNSWGPDAWTFPTASTTLLAPDAPSSIINTSPPTFQSLDASTLPFTFFPPNSDASLSVLNASPAFPCPEADASTMPFAFFAPNAPTNQFTDFAPLQGDLGIASLESDASPPFLRLPDTSTAPFADLTLLQAPEETILPPDASIALSQASDASLPILGPLHASTTPFAGFTPSEEAILPLPDASTAPFTVFPPLQAPEEAILPLPDASMAPFTVFPPLQVSEEAITPLPDASPSLITVSTPSQQPSSIVVSANAPNERDTSLLQDTYVPSCAVMTTLTPTPAVNHKHDIPLSATNSLTNDNGEATADDIPQHQPLNTVPARRSTRTVVPSTRADVMNNIGSRVARVDKENVPVLNPASLDQRPTWLSDARSYLEACKLGKEWVQCVNAWAEFEVRITETRTTKGALPSTDLRPDEWTKWTMKGKHGVRPYHVTPDIASPLEFGTQIIKWWYNMQPAFRQGEDKLPTRLSESHLPDNIESEWAPLRKGGTNGLVSVLTLLAWWGQLASTSTQWEDSTFTDWKAIVLDVTEVLLAVSGVSTSRKREIGSSIDRVCKRARTK